MSGVAYNVFDGMRGEFNFGMRIIMSNLWIFSGLLSRILSAKHKTATMVRTTTALTIFNAGFKRNVIPVSAHASVNHRVHPNDTCAEILERDNQIINDERVVAKIVDSTEPSPVSDENHQTFGIFKKVCAAVYPDACVAPGLFVAASDSKWFWKLAPQIYRFNPIRIHASQTAMFHGIDERISVKNYAEMVCFMREFVSEVDTTCCHH
jgi:carboxypeptidase PM20D1